MGLSNAMLAFVVVNEVKPDLVLLLVVEVNNEGAKNHGRVRFTQLKGEDLKLHAASTSTE